MSLPPRLRPAAPCAALAAMFPACLALFCMLLAAALPAATPGAGGRGLPAGLHAAADVPKAPAAACCGFGAESERPGPEALTMPLLMSCPGPGAWPQAGHGDGDGRIGSGIGARDGMSATLQASLRNRAGPSPVVPAAAGDRDGGCAMMIGTSISPGNLLLASAGPPAGGGEEGGGTPGTPSPGLYPDVPAVSLTSSGGSLMFPEGNGSAATARAGLEGYKALLSQSVAGLYFQPGTAYQAYMAVVRLPKDKRYGNTLFGIMGKSGTGGKKFWLRYNGGATPSNPNRFQFYFAGNGGASVSLASAEWTEDEALVVVTCNAANQWQIDWYSLKDGTRFAGTPVTAATTGFTADGVINIGGTGEATAFTVNGEGARWPGSIEQVGYFANAGAAALVDPALWSAVALGRDLRDGAVLPLAGKFVRRFDGSAASLIRDDYWTGDATAATAIVGSTTAGVPGSTVLPGTTFRRQSQTQYLLFDGLSGGQVYGLAKGQTERAVPFSGTAAGFSGPVEIRVYEAETGRVVRDWTEVATPSGGVWSGSLTLPESTGGWLFAEARAKDRPALVAHRRDPFGVGWKFMVMGQSQTQIGMFGGPAQQPITEPMSASYADLRVTGVRATNGAAARWPVMGRIGMAYATDGTVTFLNQFRRFKPKVPVMIYDDAVNGTSMRTLLEGGVHTEDRQWADITDKLALYGNDVTAVIWNWLMNEGASSGSDVAPLMSAMFLPASQNDMAHSLVKELAPGWTLGVLGGDRESYITGREGMRRERARFAQDNGFALGPVVSDYRIEDGGGPHPIAQDSLPGQAGYGPTAALPHGPARFGQRMAVTALRAIGLDASQNPYYANARLSPDRTTILIDAVAVNGGTISSPAPTALRSWYVKEPADGDYATTLAKGARAILNGTTVEITRATGSWPAGTRIMRMDDSEKRAAGDGAAEDAIHAGGIYESWPLDPLGFGFPVVGRRDAEGKWWPLFEATL